MTYALLLFAVESYDTKDLSLLSMELYVFLDLGAGDWKRAADDRFFFADECMNISE
jgi:hypothetical protein